MLRLRLSRLTDIHDGIIVHSSHQQSEAVAFCRVHGSKARSLVQVPDAPLNL